ncbi:hypothetical protein [uncultured Vagococcus sp.]|uniref:hypothetical protein n=1 Tax=uncultured Vagococcus sp. TaxID=189676 RepID=UPI0028D2D8E6|nr:hypothetical protein [uncultured Vagococcus sp.]
MLEERRKAELISHELLRYFFIHRVANIQMNVVFEGRQFIVSVQGEMAEPPRDLEEVSWLLSVERDPDLDEYVEGLVGTHHEAEDFSLLGIMTDDAQVDYSEGRLMIKLYRTLTPKK